MSTSRKRNGSGRVAPKSSAARAARAMRGRTRSSEVFEVLRADIVRLRLAPGEKLQFDQTRKRYNVGLSPLREALLRLSGDGLVVLQDQKGFSVAPVSRADLLDVTKLRLELEPWAFRLAMEKGGDQWEAAVVNATHQLSGESRHAPSPESPVGFNPEWERRHGTFHRVLVSACESPWLMRVRDPLFDHTDRYRRLHQLHAPPRDDLGEHRALMRAALNRDITGGIELLRKHISQTTDELLANTQLFEVQS